jgi:asparagine synthase (glutamine-hydrolysing)
MCGICGIIDSSGFPIREDLLWCMTHTLKHRGPDDSGIFVAKGVGLGHTRLSIIDPTPAGHQPMLSDDGRCVLVYNGEIYNFQELRQSLAEKGVEFHGRSDTEVVLKSYLHFGTDAFALCKGMFALALWDGRTRELHAVRDRFGIKPFYYYPFESGIVFGSEIKAILAAGKMARRVNPAALHEYLYYGTALGTHTLFDGVVKLLPGYRLTVDRNGLTTTPYTSIYDTEQVPEDLETATQKTRWRLEQAVKSHLVSDVPVGVFLSGGVDSSTITALASRHYEGRLKTFSVGFDFDRGVNELPKARLVATHYGTDHHELHLVGKDVPNTMEKLVQCHDEPFGDAANIPLYLLCQELKGSVKVILQGDGGDEIFAGYRRYNVLSIERLWHWLAWIASLLGSMCPRAPAYYRYMRFLQAMRHPDLAMRMALLLTEEPLDNPPTRVLTKEMRESLNGYDPFARYRECYTQFSHLDPVQRMLYTDCSILLPDIFLEKVDKATMAHGIEVRVPLLDTDLVRYIIGLPSSLKIRRGQKKWLLRRAMRGIVPDAILDGEKTGFGVPYAWWLREPLRDYMKAVLLDATTLGWGIFDQQALERCMDEHITQRRNNGFLLYKLLNLALWYRVYLTH